MAQENLGIFAPDTVILHYSCRRYSLILIIAVHLYFLLFPVFTMTASSTVIST